VSPSQQPSCVIAYELSTLFQLSALRRSSSWIEPIPQ